MASGARERRERSTVRAVLPLYAARFSCTGSACIDTCCAGWTIPVDQGSFERIRELPGGSIRDRLEACVKPAPPEQRTLKVWGTIALDERTGACPMLEGGLCSVHRDLGPDALADSCATYPRLVRASAGVWMQGLTLSCPEAARLALTAPDAFSLVEEDITPRTLPDTDTRPDGAHQALSLEDERAVVFFCVRLINTGELALWMRLAILGIFCDDLTSLMKSARGAEATALIARFEAGIESGLLVTALQRAEPDIVLQVRVAAQVLELDVAPPGSARQRAHWHAVLEGLGVATDGSGAPFDLVVSRYRRGLARLPTALASAPQLLDHVVRNDVLTEGFPFGAASPWQHFLQVVSRFGVVRLMLAGRCARDVLPTVDELVLTVQAFARRYHHTPGFAARIDAALDTLGFGELAQLYGYLRA